MLSSRLVKKIALITKYPLYTLSPSFATKSARKFWSNPKNVDTHLKNVEKIKEMIINELVSKITQQLDPSKGGTILEYGCGDGFIVSELTRKGFEAHGCDISAEMLKRASQKGIKVFNCEEIENKNINLKYDIIYTRCVLLYIHPRLLGKFVKKLSELVKPGGKLIFFHEPIYEFRHRSKNNNKHLYLLLTKYFPVYQVHIPGFWISIEKLDKILNKYGMNILKIEQVNEEYKMPYRWNIYIKKSRNVKLG